MVQVCRNRLESSSVPASRSGTGESGIRPVFGRALGRRLDRSELASVRDASTTRIELRQDCRRLSTLATKSVGLVNRMTSSPRRTYTCAGSNCKMSATAILSLFIRVSSFLEPVNDFLPVSHPAKSIHIEDAVLLLAATGRPNAREDVFRQCECPRTSCRILRRITEA